MILGEWKGHFRHQHNEGTHAIGEFTMEIFEFSNSQFKKNEFIGIIIDDTDPRGSSIKGRVSGKQISFTKTYHSIDIKLESGEIIRADKKHFIKYEGEFVSENEIYGAWFRQEHIIRGFHLDIKYAFKTEPEQGSWFAKREKL